MKATLTFDLEEYDDKKQYELHTQAERMYWAVDDIRCLIAKIRDSQEIPIEFEKIAMEELSDEEKTAQKKDWKRRYMEAEAYYIKNLAIWEERNERASKDGAAITAFKPSLVMPSHRIQLKSTTGKNLLEGSTLMHIILVCMTKIFEEQQANLEILV